MLNEETLKQVMAKLLNVDAAAIGPDASMDRDHGVTVAHANGLVSAGAASNIDRRQRPA